MIPLGPDRISWAVYPGPRGNGKGRPMIVASRRIDLIRTGQVLAVVRSTTFDEPIEPIEVRLPFHLDGDCVTKPRQDTVAVCNRTTAFEATEIREVGGLVPTALLREICSKAGITYPSER